MRLFPFFIFILVQVFIFSNNINTVDIEYNSVVVRNYSENIDSEKSTNETTPPVISEVPAVPAVPAVPEDNNEVVEDNNTSNNNSVDYLNSLDNTAINWWFGRNPDFQRPVGAMDIDKLKSYNSYYMGQDINTIYLTFDEGGNSVTYIKEIVDILNNNNVKATFFLTKNFILDNPDLVKGILAAGHIIGNHSVTHPNFTTLSVEDMKAEVLGVEEAYYSVTGKEITKVFRFPMGAFSERSLGVLKELGYSCYFWSFAYRDWEEDLDTAVSLSWFENYYHNGAIYLIHPKNKGNYLALETFIQDMKSKGYNFDLVTNIK